MTKKRCRHCHRLFIVSPRNPDQKFCSSNDCQKARKRKWQRKKMRDDPAYRLKLRFEQHNKGNVDSTKHRRPFKLIYYEACLSQADATHREKYLKSYLGRQFLHRRLKSYLTG
jgi:putative endonuclease